MRFFNDKIRDLIPRARESSNRKSKLASAVLQEHRLIFEAISAGDPSKAGDATLAHLQDAARRQNLTIFDPKKTVLSKTVINNSGFQLSKNSI